MNRFVIAIHQPFLSSHRGAARSKIDRFSKNKLWLEIFFRIVAAFYSNFFSQTALNKNHRKLPDLQILSKVATC